MCREAKGLSVDRQCYSLFSEVIACISSLLISFKHLAVVYASNLTITMRDITFRIHRQIIGLVWMRKCVYG